jgi:hypothetical protein
MKQIELTPEEIIQKSISAAFDSVNLINRLNELETLTEEEVDTKLRNQKHLEIMLNKGEFVNSLTQDQTAQINAVL